MSAAAALARAFPNGLPPRLGVAVSGGGDSMALLHLLAGKSALHIVTVDHGLRPEAAAEVALVAEAAQHLGVPHDVLQWQGWDGRGNLQDQARRARQKLIGAWARAQGISDIALGHTRDDQAETVLLRLARGSGVDGLSAMQPLQMRDGLRWHRPLLAVSRAELRAELVARGASWAEDPSNQDPRFDRVKARNALKLLEDIGITPEGLNDTAMRMTSARKVLEAAADQLSNTTATRDMGDLCLARAPLAAALPETQERLFARALRFVAPADYAPRRAALQTALARALNSETTTLAGCLILGGDPIRIAREAAATAGPAPLGTLWDDRWHVTGPANPNLTVQKLGETGLAQCPDWRATGRPHAALKADPGVWDGDTLCAAPTIDKNTPYAAQFRPDCDEFIS